MLFNHLTLCHPLLFPPSMFPSIRVFSNESVVHIRWSKYWSFSFSISPSSEYSGLISFRMDWLDLLAVQGILESLLQHHSSKASILLHSAFFIVQLSHPYMTTGKIIALTRRTFVGKVMSLLFNMLSRLVKTFLPRSKRLFISWLQSPSAVILEPPKIKSATVSTVSPSICHEVMGPDAMILVFWILSFKPLFHSPFLLSSRGSLVLLHFLPCSYYKGKEMKESPHLYYGSESCSVVSDFFQHHGLHSPWNSPGQNAGMGNLSLLQGIFPTQESDQVSCIAGRFFISWAIMKALSYQYKPTIPWVISISPPILWWPKKRAFWKVILC